MGALLTALLVAVTPAAQPAETPVEAFNRHVAAAVEHRKQARHSDAVTALDAALAAIREQSGTGFDKARSRARFYKALSLVELREYAAAESLLVILVSSPGLSVKERWVVKKRLAKVRRLRGIEAANRPGEVTVEALDAKGAPLSDAAVTIDGRPAPPPPFTVKLSPGDHVVVLSHPQLLGERQRVTVKPGSVTRLVLRPRLPEPWSPPEGAWITGGVGLGVAAIGGLLHGLAALDYDAAADTSKTWREADALARRGDRQAVAAFAAYGIAGALVLSAATWMAVDAGAHDGAPQVSGGVSVAGDSVRVQLGGLF